MPRINRKGTITVEEAREKFLDFYDNPKNGKSKIGQLRAKMFDMMYQKKPKYSYKCNTTEEEIETIGHDGNEITIQPGECEPGSQKYLYEMGPKTFDLEGIDSFKEGETVEVPNTEKNVKITSRGSTYYDQVADQHISEEDLEETDDGKYTSKEIYGPRLDTSKELYSNYFKGKYNEEKERGDFGDNDETGDKRNLVELYWDRYHNRELDEGKPYGYIRKNRKTRKVPRREITIESPEYDSPDSISSSSSSDDDDSPSPTSKKRRGRIEDIKLDDEIFFNFTTTTGNKYIINSQGQIFSDKDGIRKKIFDNIAECSDRQIINGLLENELIKRVGENTYDLNLPDEEGEGEDEDEGEHIIYHIKDSDIYIYYNESVDEVYTGTTNEEGELEIDLENSKGTLERYLQKQGLTIDNLQEINIDMEDDDEEDEDSSPNPTSHSGKSSVASSLHGVDEEDEDSSPPSHSSKGSVTSSLPGVDEEDEDSSPPSHSGKSGVASSLHEVDVEEDTPNGIAYEVANKNEYIYLDNNTGLVHKLDIDEEGNAEIDTTSNLGTLQKYLQQNNLNMGDLQLLDQEEGDDSLSGAATKTSDSDSIATKDLDSHGHSHDVDDSPNGVAYQINSPHKSAAKDEYIYLDNNTGLVHRLNIDDEGDAEIDTSENLGTLQEYLQNKKISMEDLQPLDHEHLEEDDDISSVHTTHIEPDSSGSITSKKSTLSDADLDF